MPAADLTGPLEARLLALERRQARADGALGRLARRTIALHQGIWDAWADLRHPRGVAPPPPTGVELFPDVCSPIPEVMTLTDSYYGLSIPITWDGVTNWKACAVVNKPATATCAGGLTPIFYKLVGTNSTPDWDLFIQWHKVTVGTCPEIGADCTATPYAGVSIRSTNTITCGPPFAYHAHIATQVTWLDRIYPPSTGIDVDIDA